MKVREINLNHILKGGESASDPMKFEFPLELADCSEIQDSEGKDDKGKYSEYAFPTSHYKLQSNMLNSTALIEYSYMPG